VKKISSIPVIALLFSISCLILVPQVESTPGLDSATATSQELPPAQKTSAPSIPPQNHATYTPKGTATPAASPTPDWTFSAPSPADRSVYKDDLAPEYYAALEALPYASLYSINFVIADDLYHVAGHETVTYTNAEDVALKEICLRLFPNILEGKMIVENVTVDDKPVEYFYSLHDSLLTLKLRKTLRSQESAAISMDFEITVAQSIGSHYSVQTSYDNVLSLAHAYPMIAVYDDEGWNAEIPPEQGDITYADTSFFMVTAEASARVTLVGSGRAISREESGDRQRVVYAAGPARDFYLAASPDYSVVTQEANGITLRFYARKSQQEGAAYALEVAARALEIFSARYAPYPYRELDFVSTPTTASGVEYPGMIAITRQRIIPNNMFLEAVTAHEVGHQWFYNLIGNDQLDEPWLDESLTQFVTLQYFTDAYGETGGEVFHQDLESRWEIINNNKIPIGLPVREYSGNEYGAIVYGRGALFFEALRGEMGAEAFDAFMRDYTQSDAWGIVTAEMLKIRAEEYCACDLTPLFQNWIYP
jgi:hypothetical protein